MSNPRLNQTTRTQSDMADLRAYWVDVRCGNDRGWTPLFTYSSLKVAAEMRDHWKGVKRLADYRLYLSRPVTNARVREVLVTVTIHP